MKILLEISHPADAHLFKNLITLLKQDGHQTHVVCRDKDHVCYLLDKLEIDYSKIGKKKNSMSGKISGLIGFTFQIIKIARKFKPDLFLSHGSMYMALATFFCRKPAITLDDTGNKEQVRLWKPFSKFIITGVCYQHTLGKKQIRYNGYHELAYLHPAYFTPDKKEFESLKIAPCEKIIFVRFIARNASHDFGVSALSHSRKIDIINKLSAHGKVFISSETDLPNELKKFELTLPFEKVHHLLAFSSLFFGESGTMASEAAVLGVPAIFIDHKGRFYTDDLEKKYQLVYNFALANTDIEKALEKSIDTLKNPEIFARHQENRIKMLNENIDVTKYFHNFTNSCLV